MNDKCDRCGLPVPDRYSICFKCYCASIGPHVGYIPEGQEEEFADLLSELKESWKQESEKR